MACFGTDLVNEVRSPSPLQGFGHKHWCLRHLLSYRVFVNVAARLNMRAWNDSLHVRYGESIGSDQSWLRIISDNIANIERFDKYRAKTLDQQCVTGFSCLLLLARRNRVAVSASL